MDVFVARQPIFDTKLGVHAYELLFRNGPDNFFPNVDGEIASSQMISDTSSVFGLQSLTGGRPAFINATRRVLVDQLMTMLPKDEAVVEVLETVEPDDEVIEACKALKEAGYRLALDDFVDRPDYAPLVELADVIKVDFQQTDADGRKELAQRYGAKTKLLAEKVETHEEMREGVSLGYDYFQGYFFCKPEMIQRREIPAFKLNYLRFLKEVSRPELDMDKLVEVIEQEVSLSVRLLRLLNSSAFGFNGSVNSVKQALMLLGENPTKKWASMVAMGQLGEDKPQEFVVTCLQRARMCELAASAIGLNDRAQDMFLVGMLSLVDVLIGRPTEELLDEMALSDEIKSGVLSEDNALGKVRSLAVAVERGDWDGVGEKQSVLSLAEKRLTSAYQESIAWVNQVFASEAAAAAA